MVTRRFITQNKVDDAFFQISNGEIEKIFMDAISRMYPKLKKEKIVTIKTAHAAEDFACVHLNIPKKLANKTSLDELYLINSSYISNSTLNVSDAVQLAESSVNCYF